MDQTNLGPAGPTRTITRPADSEVWSFCVDLADLIRLEKLSRWSMQQKIGERFPHLGPDQLTQSMHAALKHVLGESP